MERRSLVEQIEELAAVNLVEAHLQIVVWELAQKLDRIYSSQKVQARHSAIVCAHHRERFTRASLAIGETSGISAFKSALHERLHALHVNLHQTLAQCRKKER